MDNPESVLENEIHKLLKDFQIQTDHQNSAIRLDLVIVNKTKKKKKRKKKRKKENQPNTELCRSA